MPIEQLNRIHYNKEGIDNMKLIAMTNNGTEYLPLSFLLIEAQRKFVTS